MTSQEPSILDSLNTIFDGKLSGLNTCLPAKIESFDNTTQLASVKPLFEQVFLNEDDEEIKQDLPVIQEVPVYYPRGGGYFMAFPIKPGDIVLLVFSQRSLDNWLNSDGKTVIDSEDNRKFDLSDAVAFAGLSTKQNKINNSDSDNLVIAKENDDLILKLTNDNELQVKAGASRFGELNASIPVARSDLTDQRINNLITALNNFINTVFNVHVHTGNLGIPTTPPLNGGSSYTDSSNVESSKAFVSD